jgi:hypothetical protein
MFSLTMAVLAVIAAIALFFTRSKPPKLGGDEHPKSSHTLLLLRNRIQTIVGTSALVGGTIFGVYGAYSYNDAGYCTHAQTIHGSETAECSTGWFYTGWGRTTAWPWFITVANTNDPDAQGSAVSTPYPIRMSDNWNGDVTQTTRFAIPQDEDQFLVMHKTFRSPTRLISTTLKPAISSSLDSVSNLFSMEEYYTGGKRDQYKTEFRDAVIKGRPQVKQVTVNRDGSAIVSRAASSDLKSNQDSSTTGIVTSRKVVMRKIVGEDGLILREAHGYSQYGITVPSAILENLDPDDKFEHQMQARKDAASRRIVAQEGRKEQEEQRLLAIQTGQTNIAKRQAESQVEQIQQTTEAETTKKLALIAADRILQEAEVQRETALIKLEQAKIDAESKQVTADAEAYEKRVILEADGALQQKLDAWTTSQKYWANAASKINVPSTVFAGGGNSTAGNALGTVEQFMQMMTVNAAKQLQVDPTITK